MNNRKSDARNIVALCQNEGDDFADESSKRAWIRRSLQSSMNVLNINGSECYNSAFGGWIEPGASVLIKPNFVHHKSKEGDSLEALVTDFDLIDVVIEEVRKLRPKSIVVGDAPIQICNYTELIEKFSKKSKNANHDVSFVDFRGVMSEYSDKTRSYNIRHNVTEESMEIDLGGNSMHEPYGDANFRVSMYDHRVLKSNHRCGRHVYRVSKQLQTADYIISIPKLKTHRKAGITGALKNNIGFIEHKSYLPHHRAHGSYLGGDCYEGFNPLLELACIINDYANRSMSKRRYPLLRRLVRILKVISNTTGAVWEMEGGWIGNDTIWRTVYDVEFIVSTLRRESDKTSILYITDAIVCGEGEGPLDPSPVDMKSLTLSFDPFCADYIHAIMMGMNPEKLKIFGYAEESLQKLYLSYNGRQISIAELKNKYRRKFVPAKGWEGLLT